MANHCWNWASIEGTKENIDRFEAALISAKGDTGHLWYESYFTALSSPLPSKTEIEEINEAFQLVTK